MKGIDKFNHLKEDIKIDQCVDLVRTKAVQLLAIVLGARVETSK
jgi:hypothetical protein